MRTKTWIALSAAAALALGSAGPTFADGNAQAGSSGGNAPAAAGSGGTGNAGASAGANTSGSQSTPSNNAGNAGSTGNADSSAGGATGSNQPARGGQNTNDSNSISSDNSDRNNQNRTDPAPTDQSPGSAGSIGGTGGASPQQPVDSPDGGTTSGTGNSGIGADGTTSDPAPADSARRSDSQSAERDRTYNDASDTPSAQEHAESARRSTDEPRDVRQDDQPIDDATEAADANDRDINGNVTDEINRTDNAANDGTIQRDRIIRDNDGGYYRDNGTVVTGDRDGDRNVNDGSADRDRDTTYDDARPAGERQPAREAQPGSTASPEDLEELNAAKQEYEAQRQANIAYLMENNEEYRQLAEQRELLQARQAELTADPDADALAIEAGARELLEISTQMRDIEQTMAPNDEARQRLEDSATRVRTAEEQPRR